MTRNERNERGAGQARVRPQEKGSALIIAILIMVIMTLLGLAFALLAETENRIAINQRHQAQALYVAEGTVRMVKRWFDDPDPTTGYLVPSTTEVNRSLRYVDHDSDGTYQLYSTAPPPWNVIYRSGTNDLFEKPFRGSPAVSLEGTQANPDVRISSSGSAGEQAYLANLNDTLYPDFPVPNLRARVEQIDVFAPPVLQIGAQKVRYGIATVMVTVGVFESPGAAQENRVGERVVKAVLNEAPYPGPLGPLQSCVDINATGNFAAHWGVVTAVNNIDLHNNLDQKCDSSVPWFDITRYITQDMNLDGTMQTGSPGSPTPDDQDGNGQLDFDEWIANGLLEDPWLHFWAEQDTTSNGAIPPGCPSASDPDCQPAPYYQAGTNTLSNPVDHSNIFRNVVKDTCPKFDYDLWKSVALSGGKDIHYYEYDPGSGKYKEYGTETPVTFRQATDGQNGLFFFDSADGTKPRDDDGDGLYDNLAPDIQISGGGYESAGFIYLNAEVFRTTGSGSVTTQSTLIAPSEPYIDLNQNGFYDPDEYFIDLTYPALPTDPWVKNGMRREIDGFTRQDPFTDAAPDGRWLWDINFTGVLYTNGKYEAQGNWTYFGSVITKQGMDAQGGAGTPDIYFDERVIRDKWPPSDLKLPRTHISVWETDM